MLLPVAVLLVTFTVLALVIAVPLADMIGGITPMTAGPLPGDGIERVVDGYVSAGLVDVGDGQWALVDAGNDPEGAAIVAALQAHGATPADVAAIFVTHGHSDHVAGCGLFPNATTYLMSAEIPFVLGKEAYAGPIPRLFGASAAACPHLTAVADGGSVKVGRRVFSAFSVPGHTPGSAAWRVDGVLFIGDSASVKAGKGLVGAPWVVTDDMEQNRASLVELGGRLAGDPPVAVVPSHTGEIDGAALVRFRP